MADTAQPVVVNELTQEDLKDPKLAALNAILQQLARAANYQQGAFGAPVMHDDLDLNGHNLINVGSSKKTIS